MLDPCARSRGRPERKPAARELIAALRARGATVEDLIGDTDRASDDVGVDEPKMPWGKHRNRPLRLIDTSYLDWTLAWLKEDSERRRKCTDLIVDIEAVLAARASTRRSPAPSTAAKEGAPADAVARVLIMGSTMRCCDTACLERAAGLYGALMQSVRAPTVCTTAVRGRDG